MGAVRRLATVVIIGLVALSTLMVVYLAAEPTRRGDETTEQENTALVRGTDLYITYCLQCHGPAGLGSQAGEDPARIGPPLNLDALFSDEEQQQRVADGAQRVIYQSDDPVQQAIAEDWIRFRVTYGVPAEPYVQAKLMPAFGADLNVEEMNDLIYLIMHGDWNYVYNTAVDQTGQALVEAQCLEDPSGEYCDHPADAPPAYPTVPPRDTGGQEAQDTEAAADSADQGEQGSDSGGEATVSIDAFEMAFSETAITVKPGDTIQMTNTGMLEHDFTVDDLGIHEVTPTTGDVVTITIPEDAEPGEYEFYCSVPGHKEAGMVGTLTIEAP